MNTLIHICCAPCANRPIARLREEGLSLRDAVRQAAKELGLSRNELYDAAVKK